MGLPTNDLSALIQAQAVSNIVGVPATTMPTTLNVDRYSEDVSWAYHVPSASSTKSGTSKLAVTGNQCIALGGVTMANAFQGLSTAFGSASLAPFIAGRRYLISLYIYTDADFWWLPRAAPGASDYGQGPILCRGGCVTRVWFTATATSTTQMDMGAAPLAALGSGTAANPPWLFQNNNPAATVFVGGRQIESVRGDYVDGVAFIGDSNVQGSSGDRDRFLNLNDPSNRMISQTLSSELRLPVFNRGIGGNKLVDMDARWATDISVLKHRCYAAIVYGGTNDIPNGGTFESMSGAVQSMTAKAIADGFRRLYYVTTPPSAAMSANSAFEALRGQYNAWLKDTYGTAVYDINELVQDPATGKDLVGAAYGDGTHFPGAMRSAVGAAMAAKLDWSWRITPGPYVKVQA